MKKIVRKRAVRVKNGTTWWKVTLMNTKTSTTTIRKVRATYDEMTARVNHSRRRNPHTAVCAEEMNKWGGQLKEDGRVLTLDSLEDEKMFEETAKKQLRASDIIEFPVDEYED